MAPDNIVKITNRGMISIPAALRKKYNLKDGNRVLVVEDEGALKIIPIEDIEELKKRSITTKEMIEIIEQSRKEDLELED